ncbi:PREDICTED: uncharacterized protein LOC109180671 [Ipomoea nil]|uniref:uncharacterized protein LOC109180671 n=1 Tax=Ipomoea nil TaxID=35883 RepID=UPI00090164DB|nr:PREDICTED: uncharacterized protein LOC109180671 [Ipomoea nil]
MVSSEVMTLHVKMASTFSDNQCGSGNLNYRGHWQRGSGQNQGRGSPHRGHQGSGPSGYLVFQNDLGVDSLSNSHTWFPNTGVTNHVTPDIATLSTSEEYTNNETLRIGDGMCMSISRVGHDIFDTLSRSFKMSNILHVPGLSASLLSVQCFASDNQVFFKFHPSFFVVKDIATKAVLFQGNSSGGLYSLPVSHHTPSLFLSAQASASVRHNHLGHPHQRVLSRVMQSCSVSGSSKSLSDTSLCSGCYLER